MGWKLGFATKFYLLISKRKLPVLILQKREFLVYNVAHQPAHTINTLALRHFTLMMMLIMDMMQGIQSMMLLYSMPWVVVVVRGLVMTILGCNQ